MEKPKPWIWQNKNWPDFTYDEPDLSPLYHKLGQLEMAQKLLSDEDLAAFQAKVLELEALYTSKLEGEVLDQVLLKKSVYSHLNFSTELSSNTAQTDGLVSLLMDSKHSLEPLSPTRLFAWHQTLFSSNKEGSYPILAGQYRDEKQGEVQVVSGTWENEIIHYQAPSAHTLELEMNRLLLWLSTQNRIDPIIKSAIVHIWFLLIHPFSDGNRRLARCLSEHTLALSPLIPNTLFTLAYEIDALKNEYYSLLDKVCSNESTDITSWINWYLKIFSLSLDNALERVEEVKYKALFWDKVQGLSLNARQRKLISKMLKDEIAPKCLKTALYTELFGCSKPTAARDLIDLSHKKVLRSHGAGRGVYYQLYFEKH